MLNKMFKSVLDMERDPIVLCDTEHKILYMNPAAKKRYTKRGGAALIGKSLLECHNPNSGEIINKILSWFMQKDDNNIIFTYHSDRDNCDVYMIALRDNEGKLIGYYEKHESRTPEKSKAYDFSVSL